MARVSSFGQQQLLVNSIQRNQSELFRTQEQIATGREHSEYRSLAGETSTLLGAEAFQSRTESYRESINTVRGRLDANEVQIGSIIEAMESVQDTLRTAVTNNQAEGVPEVLQSTFQFLVNAINTNIDGTFLFAGSRTGTPPIPDNIRTIEDLQAFVDPNSDGVLEVPVADVFQNGSQASQARIADGVDLEFGVLGNDLGTEIFGVLQSVWANHTGIDPTSPGPLQGPLDSPTFEYLRGQIQVFETAIDGLRQIEVNNGLAFQRLEVIDDQHADTVDFLEVFIADIQDVDIAEAVTRLNNQQVGLEASYQTVARLGQLTLLNFL